MASLQQSTGAVDPNSGYCSETKTFYSLRPPVPSSSSTSSFLLLSHPQFIHQYFLYNTNLNSWRNQFLSLASFLPPSAALIAAAGGLLCFSIADSNSFLICNLLARTSRKVKFPAHPFEFECFTIFLTSEGYKLFVISQNSLTESWECFGSDLSIVSRTPGVCYKSRLYYTTRHNFSVLGFDFATGNWQTVAATSPGELIVWQIEDRLFSGDIFIEIAS